MGGREIREILPVVLGETEDSGILVPVSLEGFDTAQSCTNGVQVALSEGVCANRGLLGRHVGGMGGYRRV